ncbi:lipoxygenase 6, chloroplastic [Iris pallida]|uniref:Lipoxygenase n=1 Tax=Iris pallida TaxID=29817 RepID=A0AAX6ED25_IRIPA|nr:lipoxygenase 6, chloroplastic [Iris pallida]
MLLSKSTTIPNPCSRRRRSLFSASPKRTSGAGSSSSSSRRASVAVRAVISSDDKKSVAVATSSSSGQQQQRQQQMSSPPSAIDVTVVLTVRSRLKEKLLEKAKDRWEHFVTGIGQGILLQLVSNDVDHVTNSGKRSTEAAVRGWLPKPSSHPSIVEYAANFTVPYDFGQPGAIIITNLHDREFHLMDIVVHGFSDSPAFFHANSWIHSRLDSTERRVIFSNQAYLPSQTPEGLKALRKDVLVSHRGDGKGKREKFERVYDYDLYNDLGNPDKDVDLARPVLGGKERPYPRRCRTGRPPTKSDPSAESQVEKRHHVYVPRDENFEEIKQDTFSSGALRALLHNLIPALRAALSSSDRQFECFSDIDRLYKEGVLLKGETEKFMDGSILSSLLTNVTSIGERLMKYDIPSIISRDRFSWLRDNEFARQTLAGVNPVSIERLREFPILSKLDPAVYGPPESAITKECLEQELNGMSLEEAIENHRLFIVDYHDLLLPFVKKINSLKGRKAYASRTIFFLTNAGILRPIVIELSLPPKTRSSGTRKRVYTHGHDATSFWIWKFAKAHVCSNDAGVHQLVNHWLRTHACMEPYIIASHRQLSSMHPIFKLLHPHMRYTMEINALARQSLINGGGIIEKCFSPEKYSLEVSSAAYKNMWRFDMEALPADLIRRGMAVEDPTMPCGIKLVIEDYPYAADGLLVWSATEDWVKDYVNHFYPDAASVLSDAELQAWWDEIKNEGHRDKRDEPWWPALASKEDLVRILTTIIWTASGQHAAINFGQYPFGGYMPNRPTLMKRLIPQEDEPEEYQKFLMNPQYVFLSSVPSQLQATQVMAVQDTLSTHSPDEEYLGQVHESRSHWICDQKVLSLFENFSTRLEEIEETIKRRNKDSGLKNRSGAGVPPYELLLPTSGPGVTGRGIPNSISI